MAKEKIGFIKLQVKAGAANPSPPVGPALGAKGLNIMEFCKQFNARTQDKKGQIIPVVITIYSDKTFEFVTKTPPSSVLILDAVKVKKGSSIPNRDKIGSISWEQIRGIAEIKMPDLNSFKIESGMKIIAGTARSMGVKILGDNPWQNN